MIEPERRDLAWTPRWPIVRVNRRQSVAEHMYFTACYTHWIANKTNLDNADYKNLMHYMLRHDESECFMSDIPGPIKRMTGHVGDLDAVEARIQHKIFGPFPPVEPWMKAIKTLADVMDECFYLSGEKKSGNTAVNKVLEGCLFRLDDAVIAIHNIGFLSKNDAQTMRMEIRQALTSEANWHGSIVDLLVGQ